MANTPLQGAVLEIGDDLQVQFFGPAQIDGDFEEAEGGRYALSFVPPKAGDYEVHVMLQTVHITGASIKLYSMFYSIAYLRSCYF